MSAVQRAPRARPGTTLALVVALVALGCGADAVARGGGGGFGGGGFGGGGVAGGGMAQSSIAGANRSAAGAGRAGAPGPDRGRPDAGRDRDRRNGGLGNAIDGDVDPGFGNDAARIEHPLVAAAIIRNIGVTTGGVGGTYYYSLPSAGCVEEYVNGQAYIRCTEVYYQEVWSGNEVLYVVVVP